jgi:hypothetical protein
MRGHRSIPEGSGESYGSCSSVTFQQGGGRIRGSVTNSAPNGRCCSVLLARRRLKTAAVAKCVLTATRADVTSSKQERPVVLPRLVAGIADAAAELLEYDRELQERTGQ